MKIKISDTIPKTLLLPSAEGKINVLSLNNMILLTKY